MGKFNDAAKYYQEMVAAWKRFEAGKDPGYNHGSVVNNAIMLSKLDLPNPWAGMVDEPEAPAAEEKAPVEEEPAKEEPKVEEPVRKEEPRKPEFRYNDQRRDNKFRH